jgi:hypothetical protein
MAEDSIYDMVMEKLPPDVADSLTHEQKAALFSACKPVSWKRHPVNIRLSFSVPGGRYFVTLVSGLDKRSEDRRQRDAVLFPILTRGNVLFLLGIGTALCLATLVAILASTHFLHL